MVPPVLPEDPKGTTGGGLGEHPARGRRRGSSGSLRRHGATAHRWASVQQEGAGRWQHRTVPPGEQPARVCSTGGHGAPRGLRLRPKLSRGSAVWGSSPRSDPPLSPLPAASKSAHATHSTEGADPASRTGSELRARTVVEVLAVSAAPFVTAEDGGASSPDKDRGGGPSCRVAGSRRPKAAYCPRKLRLRREIHIAFWLDLAYGGVVLS
jgi:hypothetical protein